MDHILILSQCQKKEHLKRIREIQFSETSGDTEQIRCNTNEIKTKIQKRLIYSKSREGTAESNGATRFSNTSVEVQ